MEKEYATRRLGSGAGTSLTTFVHDDPQGYTVMTRDIPGGESEAVAGLGRVCEVLVGIIAEMLGASKEESVQRIAAGLAAD